MIRRRSLRWLSVSIVVCLVIGTAVLLLGANTAVGQSSDSTPYLNKTGNPDPIRVGQSEQNISDIEISFLNKTDKNKEVKLYIDLGSIESKGANTSSASIAVNDLKNGRLIDTQRLESRNNTLLKATIRVDGSNHPVQIGSVQISGINTGNAHRSGDIHYNISIIGGNQSFSAKSVRYTKTDPFKIINGSVHIPDQATLSPQLHRDRYTTAGITVNNLSGNTNSTLFITKGKENKIIGVRNISKNVLRTKQTVSVGTRLLGGDVNGFLIANSTLGSASYQIKRTLPSNITNSALATSEGRMLTANVNLTNMSYDSPQTDRIKIPNAKVTDTIDDETPYIISLHPVNSTGHLLQDKPIASSRVLTGWSDNISLYFNTTAHGSGIFRSNRYAAVIQLSYGSQTGEIISPEKSDLLRNSDLNNQFVTDGVADSGVVSINSSVNVYENNSDTGILISRDESLNRPVYSGQTLYFESNLNKHYVELHKVSNNNSRIVSVGTRLNNSSKIGYNTSNLSSGTYYIHSNGGNSERFKIIGDGDKNIDLVEVPNKFTNGDSTQILISHRVPYLSLNLNNVSNSTTTVNLSTTGTGPTPITINTYASPDSPSDFITTGSGVSVDSISGTTDPISPGTYNLTLRSEHGTAVANDTVSVTIAPRSTADLTAYTTTETAPGEFENASAIRSAIADGTLTEATTATANDTVAYAVNATGLTGLPAAANASLDRGADLGRLDGLSFGVTRTTADGANGSDGGGALGSVPNESAVHLDRDGLFLVADGETAFGTESPPADGETFEAAFRVDDDRLRRRGEGANRVTTRLTHVAPDPTGERTQTGGGGESATTPSAGPEPTGTSAPSGTGTTAGSGGSGGAGASAGSGGSGGTTGSGGSAATDVAPGAGRSPGSGDSAAGGDPPGGGGGGAAGGSRGSGDDPGTTRPGAGGAAAPGASEVPPPAGPPRPFATERTGGGADGTSTPGSRPSDGRPNGDRASGTDGEPATGPAGSGDASEAGDSVSDEAAARDLGYDDAPIRSTAYDLPGFGPVGSLAAVACVLLLVRRRT